MNREIKFRAWDKTKKYWVTSKNFESETTLSYDTNYLVAWNNYELSQYTGLKDKNGVEIFEGDIITGQYNHYDPLKDEYIYDEHMGGIVFYDSNSYRIKVIEHLCDENRQGMIGYFDFMFEGEYWAPKVLCEIKIIGNIYQNPELLEKLNQE